MMNDCQLIVQFRLRDQVADEAGAHVHTKLHYPWLSIVQTVSTASCLPRMMNDDVAVFNRRGTFARSVQSGVSCTSACTYLP